MSDRLGSSASHWAGAGPIATVRGRDDAGLGDMFSSQASALESAEARTAVVSAWTLRLVADAQIVFQRYRITMATEVRAEDSARPVIDKSARRSELRSSFANGTWEACNYSCSGSGEAGDHGWKLGNVRESARGWNLRCAPLVWDARSEWIDCRSTEYGVLLQSWF